MLSERPSLILTARQLGASMTQELPNSVEMHVARAARQRPRMRKARALRKAEKNERKVLRRLENAVAAGDTERAKHLQCLYLKSFSSSLKATSDANKRIKSRHRRRFDEVQSIAECLDPWAGTQAEVVAYAKRKPDGSFRVIMDFPLEHRALQTIVTRAIKPFIRLDPRQHAYANGGRNEACNRIIDAINRGGKWFTGLDIEQFYNTITRQHILQHIHIPERIADAVICAPENIRFRQTCGIMRSTLANVAREGISQGSSLSPLIAEAIIAHFLQDISTAAAIVNFADDFGVMARTLSELEAITMALTSALRRCPSGSLQLRPKSPPRRVSDGVDFLGYRFRRRKGHLSIMPSEKNQIKFFAKTLDYLRAMRRGNPGAAGRFQRYVKSWAQAFPHWDCGDDLLWPRIWVNGVARQHLPTALSFAKYAMRQHEGRFMPLHSSFPPVVRTPFDQHAVSQVEHWTDINPVGFRSIH